MEHYHALEAAFDDIEDADLNTTTPVRNGALHWLNQLRANGVPCAAVSKLDLSKTTKLLNVTGVAEFIPAEKMVTPEDEYATKEQTFLRAALLLRRPPSHITVYANSPEAAIAAHDAGEWGKRGVGILDGSVMIYTV